MISNLIFLSFLKDPMHINPFGVNCAFLQIQFQCTADTTFSIQVLSTQLGHPHHGKERFVYVLGGQHVAGT